MRIITKQSKVIPCINNFLSAYKTYGTKNAPFYTKERLDRISKLVPETCTVEEFETALGVKHWTVNLCDECGGDFDTLLHIGENPDYDARWQCLCVGCLMKAVGVLAQYKGED